MAEEEEPTGDEEEVLDEDEPELDDDRRERRRRLEGILRETVRRALEKGVTAGVSTIGRADSAIRGVVDDVKLPREVVGYVFSQVDETKNALVRVVAREVREFLEATDIAAELQRALTSLSFEIKTEIRFIPNEAGGVKPEVKSRTVPKVDGKSERPSPWRRKRDGKDAKDAKDAKDTPGEADPDD